MKSEEVHIHCVAMSTGGLSHEEPTRVTCFGLGKRRAKPLILPFSVDVTQDTAKDAVLDSRQDSASEPAHQWQAKSVSENPALRDGTGKGAELRGPAEQAGQAQPLHSQSSLVEAGLQNDAFGDTLAMHDSTSSLKAQRCKESAPGLQTHRVSEADDEGTYLNPEWEVNPHDIFFCSHSNGKLVKLGKGAFGVVYKGAFQGETVAVKVCKQQHVTVKAMKQFQKEVAILYGCDHPNIVKFKGACSWKGGKRTVLVTEYMEKGDLCTALGHSPSAFAWDRYGHRVALDVARGLAFLHAANIVHFDLKSANILLDKGCHAKLADVGLAKTLTQYHGEDHLSTMMATGDLGTFAWAAPEVLLGFPCDSKADIFSFGVVMWELVTTELPQGRCLRPIRVPEEASQAVADIIEDCLRHDPAARPTAEELVALLEA